MTRTTDIRALASSVTTTAAGHLALKTTKKNVEIYEKFESIAEGCKFGNIDDCELLKAKIAEF